MGECSFICDMRIERIVLNDNIVHASFIAESLSFSLSISSSVFHSFFLFVLAISIKYEQKCGVLSFFSVWCFCVYRLPFHLHAYNVFAYQFQKMKKEKKQSKGKDGTRFKYN